MTTQGDGRPARVPEGVPTTPRPEGGISYDALEKRGVLGTGGNATVYEARFRASEAEGAPQVVALKQPHATAGSAVADRFLAEAETWSRLDDHDGIVRVLDWGRSPEPWLALEFMDGGSLRDRSAGLGLGEALWTGVRIADAVHHAHRHGVAHLDVKPANVLFRTSEEGYWNAPKLTDWGVSKVLLEDTASVEGLSPRYAAPEQFDPESHGPPDDLTDIYGLGTVLYELLTGEPPFDGRPKRLMQAVLEEEPRPPTAVDPALPPELDTVLGRALAKSKDDRHASVLDLRREIERVLAGVRDYDPRADGPAIASDAARPDASTVDEDRPSAGRAYRTAVELDDQGFEQVDPGYFERRDPVAPLRAWRTGMRLVDVRAGHALDREVARDDDRVDVAERLVDRLADGEHRAVIGPPGAGKSTVCKAVVCAWVEAGYGPVLYRAGDAAGSFDRPKVIERWVRGTEGRPLVVVEDAIRAGGGSVFEALASLEDGGDEDWDVAFLLEARAEEWHATDAVGVDARLDAVRQDSVESYRLPRPDERELERLLAHVRERIDEPVDVTLADVREAVDSIGSDPRGEEGASPTPGEFLLLMHRVTEQALPLETTEATTPTTFVESVQRTYADLADAGAGALDIGVAANLLNAAGVGVYPEPLHAVALDAEHRGSDRPLDAAFDVLDGRVLFGSEESESHDDGRLRAVHGSWSTAFLAHLVDAEDDRDAHERVGRVLSAVLSLPDDEERREAVDWRLHGETPYLDRIVDEPTEWVETVLERMFDLGERRPKLAAAFGITEYSRFDLPEACPERVAVRCAFRRGRIYELAGEYERAEREFQRFESDAVESEALSERETATARAETALHRGRVARMRGRLDEAEERLSDALELYRDLDDDRGVAAALRNLGNVARKRGELDDAEAYHERSLDLYGEVGDRRGAAEAHEGLGLVEWNRGRYDAAESHYRQSLEIRRELDDVRGEAVCLANFGTLAMSRDDLARAEERHRRGLDLAREVGDRRLIADHLLELGNVAKERGDFETAESCYERSSALFDDIGDAGKAAIVLLNFGALAEVRGRFETTSERLERALAMLREVGDRRGQVLCTRNLGETARQRGEYEVAERRFRTALEIAGEMDYREDEIASLIGLGAVAGQRGRLDAAERLLNRGLEGAETIGSDRLAARARLHLGRVATERGSFEAAAVHLERSLEPRRRAGDPFDEAETLVALGDLALAEDTAARARECYEEAAEVARDGGATYQVLVAATRAAIACEVLGATRAATDWRATGDRLGTGTGPEADPLPGPALPTSARETVQQIR